MPKLSQIIEPFASVLDTPARSLNVLAIVLRKGGLITKGGRGSAGAEMTASDCTNLVLAAMLNSEATEADKWVSRIRTATQKARNPYNGKTPPVAFLRDTLGETLDCLFDGIISGTEPFNSDTHLPITNMKLHVDRPTNVLCASALWIDDGDHDGSIEFCRMGKNFDGHPESEWPRIYTQMVVDGQAKTSGISVTATIDDETIYGLADVIRGHSLDDPAQSSSN